MPIIGTDISYVYSGGGANSDPSLSLGGSPSSIPITGVLNNLFDNITETEAADGSTDYRCFYVFNDNPTDSLYDTKLFILSQVPSGASIQVGCAFANDTQKVVISGTISGGSCTLGYSPGGTVTATATMTYTTGASSLANSLQSSLNQIPDLVGAVCSAALNPVTNNLEVKITFGGQNINRYLPLMVVTDNAFTGTTVDVSMVKVLDGGPMNQIATEIAGSTVPPANVSFSSPSENSPISLGKMGPGEGFPVWVKRLATPNTPGLSDDGAIIRLKGKPFTT